jgi:hypothetical protein
MMLDAHPELAIPPETGFLATADQLAGPEGRLRQRFFELVRRFPPDSPAWEDFGIAEDTFWAVLRHVDPFSVADGCRAFYRTYAARFAKPRWGDKTPLYCLHLSAIGEMLPEARFIHVIRDGRDVALSLREMWFSPGSSMEIQAEQWQRCITAARRHGLGSGRYLEVRFEDLVAQTAPVLRAICEFIDLPWSPAMLDYHLHAPERLTEHRERRRVDGSLIISHARRLEQQALVAYPPQPSRIQAWKRSMTGDERSRYESVAGALLRELGYEAD